MRGIKEDVSKNSWTFLFLKPRLSLLCFYVHGPKSGSCHFTPHHYLFLRYRPRYLIGVTRPTCLVSCSVLSLACILLSLFAFLSFCVFLSSLSPTFKLPKRDALIGSSSQQLVSFQVTWNGDWRASRSLSFWSGVGSWPNVLCPRWWVT